MKDSLPENCISSTAISFKQFGEAAIKIQEVQANAEKHDFSSGKEDVVVISRKELEYILAHISFLNTGIAYINRVTKEAFDEHQVTLQDLPEFLKGNSSTIAINNFLRIFNDIIEDQEDRLSTLLSGSKEVKS